MPVELFVLNIFLYRRPIIATLLVGHCDLLLFVGKKLDMAWIMRHEKETGDSVHSGDSFFDEENPA